MGFPIIILSLLLLQTAFATTDDATESFDLFNPEDDTQMEADMDRKTRNDKFLRFGRRFWDYEISNDIPYDDAEVQMPPRTGRRPKNDNFIRLGRSREDMLRLNDDPLHRTTRDKTSFLRFGRSITEENKKKREKRGAIVPLPSPEPLKRHESFLRFGRNSNFMRFGRNFGHAQLPSYSVDEAFLKQIFNSRNEHLINYLNNLLKQSQDNLGHNNEI